MNPVRLLTLTGGLSSETRSLVDAMTVKPTSTRMRRIDRVIRGLKQSGVWDKLDVFYMLAAHDEQAGRLNWKNPGTFTATNSSATFTANSGFTTDGAATFVDTGYAPGTNGVQYVQNSASIGLWNLLNDTGGNSHLGCAAFAHLNTRSATNVAGGRLNDNTFSTVASTDGSGLFVYSRADANTKRFYRNGAQLGADLSVASTGLPTGSLTLGKANAVFRATQGAALFAGGSLSAAEMAALYSSLLAYMQGVGAA